MRCEQIRELLLTDYLDGRLDAAARSRVEEHTDSCAECRLVLEELQTDGARPVLAGGTRLPPESVWLRIRDSIEGRRQEQGVAEFLRSLFRSHKPAFALSTVMTVVVVGLLLARIPQRNRYALNAYLYTQAEYLAAANGETSADLGTTIEELFF